MQILWVAIECNEDLLEDVFTGKESKNAALWKMDVTSPMTIKGAAEITLRIKCDNIDAINTSVAAALVDTAENEFPAFAIQYEPLSSEKNGKLDYIEGNDPVDIVKWEPSLVGKHIVTTGIMDLKNPDAGYMPDTAAEPSEPVPSGEWHEYKLYLQPTIYNVQKGHRLELYIIPYINGHFEYDLTSLFSPEEILTRYGCAADGMALHNRDYSFTIDNASSFALIPVNDKPEQDEPSEESHSSESSGQSSEEQRREEQSSVSETSKAQETSGTTSSAEVSATVSSAESFNTGNAEPVIFIHVLLMICGAAIILIVLKKEKLRK